MTAPLRILFANHTADWGGAEVAMFDLWEGLDRDRFQPLLAVGGPGPVTDRARELGIEIEVSPMGSGSPLRKALGIPGAARRLTKVLQKRRADIVHANSMIAGYAAVLAGRRAGVPSLWHLHIVSDSRVARHFLRRAGAVVVPSGAAAAALPPGLAERAHVIANGLHPRYFEASTDRAELRTELGLPAEAPLVGIVGRIDPHKGHDVFVEAARQLRDRLPEARFAVVGGASFSTNLARVAGFEATLRSRIDELGLSDRFSFLGHRDDVVPVLRGLDALAVPSVTPESLPRTIAEAQAIGCPVVASRIGGTPEMIDADVDGLLVRPGDGSELAAALLRLLTDGALAHRLADVAKSKAGQRYSLRACGQAFERIYRSLLRGPE